MQLVKPLSVTHIKVLISQISVYSSQKDDYLTIQRSFGIFDILLHVVEGKQKFKPLKFQPSLALVNRSFEVSEQSYACSASVFSELIDI